MYGRKHVNSKNIFKLITDYDVFQYYILNFKNVGRSFSSELRSDPTPSCSIKRYGNKLFYRDFGDGEGKSLGSVGYVMKKFTLTYYQALSMINRDFNLGLSSSDSISIRKPAREPVIHKLSIEDIPNAPTEILVKGRKWESKDGNYWKSRYNITLKTLRKYKVIPITEYTIVSSKGVFHILCDFHCYAYYVGKDENRELWKIYQPYRTKKDRGKWMSNISETYLQGYDELPWLGDLLVITKSLKDVMVLDTLNYASIAPHGENFKISKEIMKQLQHRFEHIIVLYDNDIEGKKAANKLYEAYPFLQAVFLPTEKSKDVSDYVDNYSLEELDQTLLQLFKSEDKIKQKV